MLFFWIVLVLVSVVAAIVSVTYSANYFRYSGAEKRWGSSVIAVMFPVFILGLIIVNFTLRKEQFETPFAFIVWTLFFLFLSFVFASGIYEDRQERYKKVAQMKFDNRVYKELQRQREANSDA